MLHPQRTHGFQLTQSHSRLITSRVVCVPHCQSSSYPSFSILKICSVTPRVRDSLGPWPCACPENPSIDQPDKQSLDGLKHSAFLGLGGFTRAPSLPTHHPQEPNGVTTRMMLDGPDVQYQPDDPGSLRFGRDQSLINLKPSGSHCHRGPMPSSQLHPLSRSPLDSVAVSSQIIN